jgi:hypothetical protein
MSTMMLAEERVGNGFDSLARHASFADAGFDDDDDGWYDADIDADIDDGADLDWPDDAIDACAPEGAHALAL